MKILNEYENERTGNDCLIKEYICLIKIDDHLYIVTFTNCVIGGWTGNPVTSTCETFDNVIDASTYMINLTKK